MHGNDPELVLLQVNPLHTVPVLQHRGLTLTDSHAIMIYLCEQFGSGDGNSVLWPKDATERIQVLNRLFYSGTLLFRRDSDAIVILCFLPISDGSKANGRGKNNFRATSS